MITTPLKKDIQNLERLLQLRLGSLGVVLKGRELKNNREGSKGKRGTHWVKPELRTAIEKEELEIAVDDFKTVLAQIRKLK